MRLCCCNRYKVRLKRSSPYLHKVLYSKRPRYTKAKKIFSFIFGVLLGIGFHHLIIVDLNLSDGASFLTGLFLCLLLGFGNALSAQIRCITLLTLPSIGGKVGQSVIKTFAIAFILAGPIANLTNNGKEVVRVFSCTTSLTFNITKTRFELMFKPFSDALMGIKGDANEVKDTLRSIRDVSAPIVGEVEDESEMQKLKEENDYIDKSLGDSLRSKEISDKYATKGEEIEAMKFEKKYLSKIETRCEDQFSKAAMKCKKMFGKAYDTCYDSVSWVAAWLLCWPMRLDFVCNIAQALGGSSRCDPSKDIDPGFGEGYTYLKNARGQFSQKFKKVRIQYQVPKIKKLIDFRDSRDTASIILHNVQRKKKILDGVFMLIKRLLAFTFLRIILVARKYHEEYLTKIEFDNIYVTSYFRRVDARRKEQGKYFILPLKKIEQKKLVDPCTPIPLKHERKEWIRQTLFLLIEIFTVTIFILLDRLFYEGLDVVRKHSRINYVQTGHHDMTLEVKGTGMIANLLRSVVKGFNVKKHIHIERNNEKCLPQPSRMSNYYLVKIYVTYLAIWCLIMGNMLIQRTRRAICGYFYRRREKRRVLYIYNEMLKRRVGFFRFMKKKVQKMVRQRYLQDQLNVFNILKIRYPKLCGCLRFLPAGRRSCLMCNEMEPIFKSKFKECPIELCHFLYCPECWLDAEEKCLACATKGEEEISSGLESSTDED